MPSSAGKAYYPQPFDKIRSSLNTIGVFAVREGIDDSPTKDILDAVERFISNEQDDSKQCFEELLPPISRLYTQSYQQHISDVLSKTADEQPSPLISCTRPMTYEKYTSRFRTNVAFPREISSVNQRAEDDLDKQKNEDLDRPNTSVCTSSGNGLHSDASTEPSLVNGCDGIFCDHCRRWHIFDHNYHMYLETFTVYESIQSIPLERELKLDILRLVQNNIALHPSFRFQNDILMLPPAPTVTPPQMMPTPAKSTIEKLKDAQNSFVEIAAVSSNLEVYLKFMASAECHPTFGSALMPLVTPHMLRNITQKGPLFGGEEYE
ncbi:uncharacterized protein PV07_12595 [Cladophialophora immunda]|uniref:Uncharacterized protein n=1 Tax=Cladophialophora immunda TaxID=569365 RepID=A0A0D2AB92_9EURO|nr:uncharacterized protein PV07_12595 [Cladophialophora immunda]KIW22002.1 hypothetical protein PV07_12595 [Cladophialophora immunda]